MKRAIMLALALSGCATISTAPFRSGMDRLVGQPAETAFSRLGYPDRQEIIAGRTVYYWGTDASPCSFKIVVADGRVKTWDGYGSPAGCSIYLKGLDRPPS